MRSVRVSDIIWTVFHISVIEFVLRITHKPPSREGVEGLRRKGLQSHSNWETTQTYVSARNSTSTLRLIRVLGAPLSSTDYILLRVFLFTCF